MDSRAKDTSEVAMAERPRENMIETAVKFLQNPKVRQSAFQQRIQFLEKKGLTKEEIRLALESSGTAGDEHQTPSHTPPHNPAVGVGNTSVIPYHHPPISAWSKARDYAATAILVGGVSYAAYVLYQKYIRQYLFGPSEREKQMAALEAGVVELRQNIAHTLTAVQEMQKTLSAQQETVSQVVRTDASKRGSGELNLMQEKQALNEIKTELQSLKGLLLSRKQFPPTPQISPIIPSWQLANKSAATNTTAASAYVTEEALATNASVAMATTGETLATSDVVATETSGDSLATNGATTTANGDSLATNDTVTMTTNGDFLATNDSVTMTTNGDFLATDDSVSMTTNGGSLATNDSVTMTANGKSLATVDNIQDSDVADKSDKMDGEDQELSQTTPAENGTVQIGEPPVEVKGEGSDLAGQGSPSSISVAAIENEASNVSS